jgi:hypothetical protein
MASGFVSEGGLQRGRVIAVTVAFEERELLSTVLLKYYFFGMAG